MSEGPKKKPGRPQKQPPEGSIGARVRGLREAADITPAELGKKIGLGEKMVYQGELKSNFSNTALINIARVFDDDLGQEWLRPYLSASRTGSSSHKKDSTEDNPLPVKEITTLYKKLKSENQVLAGTYMGKLLEGQAAGFKTMGVALVAGTKTQEEGMKLEEVEEEAPERRRVRVKR